MVSESKEIVTVDLASANNVSFLQSKSEPVVPIDWKNPYQIKEGEFSNYVDSLYGIGKDLKISDYQVHYTSQAYSFQMTDVEDKIVNFILKNF